MEFVGRRAGGIGSRPRLTVMRLLPLLLVAVAGALLVRDTSGPAATPGPAEPAAAVAAFAKVPLGFAPNRGQSDPATLFEAKGPGYAFGFSRAGCRSSSARASGPPACGFASWTAAPGRASSRSAACRARSTTSAARPPATHTGLPSFAELRYREVWPGIDMYARGERGALKYEFHIRPGADPGRHRPRVRWRPGARDPPDGGLRVHTELGSASDRPPVSYQVVDGKRVPVRSNFALRRRLRLRLRRGQPRLGPAASHRPRVSSTPPTWASRRSAAATSRSTLRATLIWPARRSRRTSPPHPDPYDTTIRCQP